METLTDREKILIQQAVEEYKKDSIPLTFEINPEKHYNDHVYREGWIRRDYNDLESILCLYRTTRGLFTKILIGLAVVGVGCSIAIAFLSKYFKSFWS
jgi:hypothetical protein